MERSGQIVLRGIDRNTKMRYYSVPKAPLDQTADAVAEEETD